MIDFVLGLALAAMLVRGWTRGFVRESLDLVALILGVWLAFRLSGPFGDFLTTAFDIGPEAARIGGGVVLFFLFGALLSIAAYYLSKVMNLPGLSMVNRVGGAAVAMGWGVVIVLVASSVASAMPLPESWRDGLDESNVVRAIAGEEAVPKGVFESVAGDNVMAAMSSIQEVFGVSRAVPVRSETLEFPAAAADEIRQVRSEADRVLDEVNQHRVSVGLRAVTGIAAMTELAEDQATGLYRGGLLRRMGDCAANLARRSHQVLRCDNGVALAGTAIGGFDGIVETPEGRTMVENPDFDRGGVGVVDGPTGRLVVIVLAG